MFLDLLQGILSPSQLEVLQKKLRTMHGDIYKDKVTWETKSSKRKSIKHSIVRDFGYGTVSFLYGASDSAKAKEYTKTELGIFLTVYFEL